MAIIYVRSTDGSDASDGSTWADAKATVSGAAAIDGAGDTIYVSQAHAESLGASQTWAFAGTLASPVRVIAANDGAEPPTAVSTASCSTTGNFFITATGSAYFRGLTLQTSTTPGNNSAADISLTPGTSNRQVWENCAFNILSTNAGAVVTLGSSAATLSEEIELRNCTIRTDADGKIACGGKITWKGGSYVAGTTHATFLDVSGRGLDMLIEGVDLSAIGSACDIMDGSPANSAGAVLKLVLRNCKMPSSWTGTLLDANPTTHQFRAEMYNCDSGATNYHMQVMDYSGTAVQESTIVRTSGASDGTTALAWKLTSTANAKYPDAPFVSQEIVQWNELTGSSKTVTVEFVHDTNVAAGQGAGTASAFQNDEVWMEVQYLSASGSPLGAFVSSVKADILATAADIASSSATWTTTGLTTPVKQKFEVSFTPQMKGFIHAKIYVGKASKTIYVDPVLQVS